MLMVAQKAVRKVQWSAVQKDGPLVVEMAALRVAKWEARRAANLVSRSAVHLAQQMVVYSAVR